MSESVESMSIDSVKIMYPLFSLFLQRITIVEVTSKLLGVNYIFGTNHCLNIQIASGKELHIPPHDKAHDFK